MKKSSTKANKAMRAEYDFSQGVRGKYSKGKSRSADEKMTAADWNKFEKDIAAFEKIP